MNYPTHCARCGAELAKSASTMSKFNTDTICVECKRDERLAPNYAEADRAEVAAVQAGNHNFPGMGLRPEDEAFLAQRRRARGGAA